MYDIKHRHDYPPYRMYQNSNIFFKISKNVVSFLLFFIIKHVDHEEQMKKIWK